MRPRSAPTTSTLRSRLAAAALLSACAAHASAAIIHVNASAPPGGNGASWATASNNLRTALLAATSGDQVWIARGTYIPDTLLDRGVRFTINSGVKVYGGFAGNETSIAQRPADNDPAAADPAFDTILSGEIGAPGNTDNTILLVNFVDFASAATALDRVVIRDANNSSGFGGGARVSNSSHPTITNVLFTNNNAGSGGALWIDLSSNPTIENCIFKSNTAPDAAGTLIRQNSNPTFRNCTFDSNIASSGGGAMELAFSGRATVENSTFRSNQGGGVGGGAIQVVISSTITVRDCTFTSNSGTPFPVGSGGGAIRLNASTFFAERCTFTSNSASQGGVVDTQNGTATFNDCTFSMNTGTFGGVAVIYAPNTSFNDCTFDSNNGDSGGVINANAFFSATRCTFRNNTAAGTIRSGGAIYASAGGTLTDCVFESNHANVAGVIYPLGGTFTFERCSLIGNAATASGGVSFHQGGSLIFRNSLIVGNSASIFAGVSYVASGSATFVNCTVADNFNPSQAVFTIGSGSASASNSIFRNQGNELDGTGTRTATYSSIQGGFAGTGNIADAPVFMNTLQMDYRLAPGSPGIDAANNALLPLTSTTDLDGNPRFQDDAASPDTGVGPAPIADLGAYELQAPPTCPGDANSDGLVNFADITSVLSEFNNTGPAGDANNDGFVNFSDITSVLSNFNAACS